MMPDDDDDDDDDDNNDDGDDGDDDDDDDDAQAAQPHHASGYQPYAPIMVKDTHAQAAQQPLTKVFNHILVLQTLIVLDRQTDTQSHAAARGPSRFPGRRIGLDGASCEK
jgi:hypothetical protein